MKSQNQRLLQYLTKHKSINPMEAWVKLGIYRLGARIYDLRRHGQRIESKAKVVSNRFGEPCRFAEYRIKG